MIGWLKIGGGLLAAAALAAAGWLISDRFDQKARADAAETCDAAAGDSSALLDDCLPGLRAAIEAQRRAATCDAALEGGELFAIRASCSTPVKTLVAERDAASGELESAKDTIETLLNDQSRAVERAEKRAVEALTRAKRNEETINSLPRVVDGLLECDADCLRDLAS